MSKAIVNIPALCAHPIGNPDSLGSYVSSQPIIQLKELEVDRVRYDQWKASISKPKSRRSR
jgi:hypothetical protein